MAFRLARGALILAALVVPVGVVSVVGPGCGSTPVDDDAGDDAGAGGGNADADADTTVPPTVTVLTPDADPLPGQTKCEVTITTGITVGKAVHVATCSDVEYATNPPSGGDHWGIWAPYQTYEAPIPREMYVHDMEHGAVMLLYKCDGECPDVLETLAAGRDAVTGDPKCLQIPGGPTERVIIAPDPDLDVPVAAAAWGATYRATCLDPASLKDFVKKAYDKGPESLCGELSSGFPICVDGGISDAGPDATGSGGSGGSGGGGAGGAGGAGGG